MSTVATWLQEAYIPSGWTEWYSPNGGNPYSGFDYQLDENGQTVSYGHADADYLTDVISDKTIDFIRRSVEQHPEQPFFAYVAPYAPHLPATPAPRHADALPGLAAPRTNSINEPDVSDKPGWVRNAPLLTEAEITVLDQAPPIAVGHRRDGPAHRRHPASPRSTGQHLRLLHVRHRHSAVHWPAHG